MSRFAFTDRSQLRDLSRPSPRQPRRLPFLTEQRSPVLLASRSILMLSQLLRQTAYPQRLSAVATVSVPRIHRPQAYSLYMRSSRRTSPSTSSQSESPMTSPAFHFRKRKLRTPRLPAPSSASSGVSAATVLSVPTRTPSRLSVTTQISMFRHTSSMTQRRRAVSPSPTFVSATAR